MEASLNNHQRWHSTGDHHKSSAVRPNERPIFKDQSHHNEDGHHRYFTHQEPFPDDDDDSGTSAHEEQSRHDDRVLDHYSHARRHDVHVEKGPSSWYGALRGANYAKQANLEENIIHYVLQYARIISEILQVPRIREKDLARREKIEVDSFKQCIERNIRNALNDSDQACCLKAGVKFEACTDLSRKLLGSLKALKEFLRNETEKQHEKPNDIAFNEFLNKHLSTREISKLWSIGRTAGMSFLAIALVYLLVYAAAAGMFGTAAQLLHLPPNISSALYNLFGSAGVGVVGTSAGATVTNTTAVITSTAPILGGATVLTGSVGGATALPQSVLDAALKILQPISAQIPSIENLTAVASSLGGSVAGHMSALLSMFAAKTVLGFSGVNQMNSTSVLPTHTHKVHPILSVGPLYPHQFYPPVTPRYV